MTIERTVIVSFSPTRTTHKILHAVAQGISLPCLDIDMTSSETRKKPVALTENDLLLIGFPVYSGRLPRIQETIFPLLHRGKTPVIPIVVYGNRAYEDALLELATLCRGKGYTPVAAAAFIGEHSFSAELGANRPDENDTALAAQFGQLAFASLQQGKVLGKKDIPGNTPFKELPQKAPFAPETLPHCTHCMTCVSLCPMQAITPDKPEEVDVERCILCAACIKGCPEQAKKITVAPFLQRIQGIVEENRSPKAPECFYPA